MSNGIGAAVDEAARLDEIGFPEFTTKLIVDVFDALVSSNIRQMESYTELLTAVSKDLATYINETQDDIDGAQLLQFLAQVLPAAEDDDEDEDAPSLPSGTLDEDGVQQILDAVARRLAANRFELLTQLVRQGLLRLVVERGTIETRLTFTTYATSTSQRQRRTYDRRSRARRAGVNASITTKVFGLGASASTESTRMRVRTTSQQDADTSGSRVQIYGGVTLNFRTDFLPLDQ